MERYYLLITSFLLASQLSGCDSPDNRPASEKSQSLPEVTPAPTPSEPLKPIDLTISEGMLEQQKQEKDFLAPIEMPSTSKNLTKKGEDEDKVRFSGKLRMDDRTTENYQDYIDSVEGGEVNVEVKFE